MNTKTKLKTVATGNPNPNKDLQLSGIDYANLNGGAFKQYQDVVAGLFLNDKYDFEMWKASSMIEYEEDRKSKTPRKIEIMVGIILNGNKPIQTTRIKLKDALELNRQVSHNLADAGNSKYFLLAKPV